MHAVDEKIGRFIGNSDTVFIIPPFQRNYSWEEEQCSELFDDIKSSIISDFILIFSPHFGQIYSLFSFL